MPPQASCKLKVAFPQAKKVSKSVAKNTDHPILLQ